MNEIEEIIKILKNFVPSFTFCELYDMKKNDQNRCKQISTS
jgi:hypothetical protein